MKHTLGIHHYDNTVYFLFNHWSNCSLDFHLILQIVVCYAAGLSSSVFPLRYTTIALQHPLITEPLVKMMWSCGWEWAKWFHVSEGQSHQKPITSSSAKLNDDFVIRQSPILLLLNCCPYPMLPIWFLLPAPSKTSHILYFSLCLCVGLKQGDDLSYWQHWGRSSLVHAFVVSESVSEHLHSKSILEKKFICCFNIVAHRTVTKRKVKKRPGNIKR